MPSRTPRWGFLAIFAICNLAFWVTVAVAVGVMASDVVDLGVESFVREKQATVVALRDQVPQKAPSRTPPPTIVAAIQATTTETETIPKETVSSGAPPQTSTPYPTNDLPATPRSQQRVTPFETRTPLPPPPSPTSLPPRSAPTTIATTTTSNSRPPAATVTVTAKPPSRPLLLSDPTMEELAALDAEIRASASGRPVQIRYQEQALNHEINAMLATMPDLPYGNVQADLQSGRVTLTGDVTVVGLQLPTQVEGRVIAENCVPAIELESVSIGGLLTPAFVKEQVAEIVQDSLNWYPADYPLCLEQIVMEQGRATIYGSRR